MLTFYWSDVDKKKVNGHIKQVQKNCKKINKGLRGVVTQEHGVEVEAAG